MSSRKRAWLVSLGVLALLAIFLLWYGLGRRSRARPLARRVSSSSASSSAKLSPPPQFGCLEIEPSTVTLLAGGEVIFELRFRPGAGRADFVWNASGGGFVAGEGEGLVTRLPGLICADPFDAGELNRSLWDIEQSSALAQVTLRDGQLHLVNPGGGPEDAVVRVKSRCRFEADFAAEVRVSVASQGNQGAGLLGFLTPLGSQAHEQVLETPELVIVESNVLNRDGVWQQSQHAALSTRQVRLQLARVRDRVYHRYDTGNGWRDLGASPHLFEEDPGVLVLDAWSLKERPKVEVSFDNFGAAYNTRVAWRAPRQVAAGTSFEISAAGCRAVATIVRPASPPPAQAAASRE